MLVQRSADVVGRGFARFSRLTRVSRVAVRTTHLLSPPPAVVPVKAGVPRPRFSVMIPAFNCARYLGQAIESVLAQALPAEEMEIEVVDDCSTLDDPRSVVEAVGRGRVGFHCRPSNGGASRAFNTCVERARGEWIHILHGDDFVMPGFYGAIDCASRRWPEAGLIAARCFFCDEAGVPEGITARLPGMEQGPTHDPSPFFRITPVQCAGVVVRREVYEQVGGFRPELVYLLDREMWCRAVFAAGGVVLADVLASYRRSTASITGRTRRKAAQLVDAERCAAIMAAEYEGFPAGTVRDDIVEWARSEADFFRSRGDTEGLAACRGFWAKRAGLRHRVAAGVIAAEAATRSWTRRLLRRPPQA